MTDMTLFRSRDSHTAGESRLKGNNRFNHRQSLPYGRGSESTGNNRFHHRQSLPYGRGSESTGNNRFNHRQSLPYGRGSESTSERALEAGQMYRPDNLSPRYVEFFRGVVDG